MIRTVNVSFPVSCKVINWSSGQVAKHVSEMLARSLIMKELNINHIIIDGNKFDLEEIRKKDRRIK